MSNTNDTNQGNINTIQYSCTFCGKPYVWGHQCNTGTNVTTSAMQGFCNVCGRTYYGSHECDPTIPVLNHRLTCTSGGACLECDGELQIVKSGSKVLYKKCRTCITEEVYPIEPHATRHNQGKVDLSLLPRVASLEQCKVWQRGASKYGKDNWKKLWGADTINVAGASAMRHLLSLLSGEEMDRETGLPHAAHVSCNMSMILEWMAREGMIQPEVYEPSEKENK